MLTVKQAKSLVFELRDAIRQWDTWAPTPDQLLNWQGIGVKPLTEELQQVIIRVGEAFQTDQIESGAWELTLAVDLFHAEFGRWMLSASIAPEAVDPGGTPEIWSTWRALLKVADQRKPPSPPHATTLQAQGCNVSTIAMRYGWLTEDGRPDTVRVNRELSATPSEREYDPDNWIHPRERKLHEQIAEKFRERCERLQKAQEKMNPRLAERQPCKESWEELFELPYMSLQQIARMKMASEDDVRAKMDELGYVRCAEGFRRAHETGRVPRGDKDPDFLSRHNPHDEFGDDIQSRVIACFNDGLKAKSIADLLSGSRNLPVTPQQAAKIIKDYKAQETAA